MRTNVIRIAKRIARFIRQRLIDGRSILIYHRVAKADFDPWNIAISPDAFERQLVGLRKKTVLPLREFARLHIRKKLPRNAIAITFDDGYACNAIVAAPMLKSFGYPATFFVVSDAIARSEEFWWDQFERIFHSPGFDYVTAIRLLANLSPDGIGKAIHDDSTHSFFALWRVLRGLGVEVRRQYLNDLRNELGLENELRPTHRPMTVAELRTLATDPLFEIGGHTTTHPCLTLLPAGEQEREIVFGAHFLERTLGQPIRTFAYPFGEWGQVTRNIVMAAGFECAVTAEQRRVSSGDNLFELPRRQFVDRSF
jgi:peptidoglycan/xylan/chitin deacetylase (PgdA/CDA1 family)